MAKVIIRVEFRGEPGAAVYKKLHTYMARLKWSLTITGGGTGTPHDLPHAMYCGSSDMALPVLAQSLKKGIKSEVECDAYVMVIEWAGWALSPRSEEW